MKDHHLHWTEIERDTVLEAKIYRIDRSHRRAADGRSAHYYVMESPDWANVVALTRDEAGRDCFVMVRQFRHGTMNVSLEFPGGVVDPGESPRDAVERELLEETGYRAESFVQLGAVHPNPALMSNRCYTFLAKEAAPAEVQSLDANEIIDVELVPVEELAADRRRPEFDHAMMLVAYHLFCEWKE